MSARAGLLIAFVLLAGAGPPAGGDDGAGGPLAGAIDAARARVVKLYGGGFARERGFGSGVIVTADGKIVTTLSILLESPALRAVLPDGRRFPAQVIQRDEQRQLALLQVEAGDLPFFELGSSGHLQPGDWVVAAANPFKVADGPEPVSVTAGVFSGRVELSARRRKQDFAYEGPVLITDIIVTTPGSAGGALVDAEGRFVGLIGKAVVSKRTNTWANYALPVEQVADFVRGKAASSEVSAADEVTPRPDLGIRLLDFGGRSRPAYVERVRPDSPAREAGIHPNDLIVSVDGQAIGTCSEFHEVRERLRLGEEVVIVVKRGEELRSITLTVGGRK